MSTGIILSVVIGYLLGSIPFALVIGKVFYKTDIRKHGSGNLGGGNAGRVLGKKAGLSVMVMDILKVTLAIFIASFFENAEVTMVAAGLASAIGHCFPVFAKFKGGKAVATMYGFFFGLIVVASYSIWLFLIPLFSFLIILYLTKIISISSIGSSIVGAVYVYLTVESRLVFAAMLFFVVMLIWRHRSNLIRVIHGEENKISWM